MQLQPSKTITVCVSDLSDLALDWAVEKCAGDPDSIVDPKSVIWLFNPSINWEQGGPIIWREKIAVYCPKGEDVWYSYPQNHNEQTKLYCGKTPLIAAMRCYVASKLGNEVAIPEELL